MAEGKTGLKSIILRILFIIAIIVVVIALAFAVLRLLPMAFSSFASVGSALTSPFRSNSILVESSDNIIDTSDQFTVSWDHDEKTSGVYNISYECIDNLRVYVINPGDQVRNLLCNTQYPINENSIDLEAHLDDGNSFVDLPIEISYVTGATRNIEASGDVIVTIQNPNSISGDNAGATIIGEPITDVEYDSRDDSEDDVENDDDITDEDDRNDNNNTYVTPIASSPADLAITNVVAIGDVTISFTISNIGGRSTGVWYFDYNIPGEGVERSPAQVSLSPGQAILYTVTFDEADRGTVAITADSLNRVSERSELNNTATVSINGGHSGNNNHNYDDDDDADLEIEDLEVGRMNGSRFVEDDEIDEDDDAAVRFTVINRGGESTGSWRFEISNVPYDNDDDFRSSRQDSLRPGESTEIIVEFENPDDGNYNIKVEVDSEDDVDEEDERNNDESERLEIDR